MCPYQHLLNQPPCLSPYLQRRSPAPPRPTASRHASAAAAPARTRLPPPPHPRPPTPATRTRAELGGGCEEAEALANSGYLGWPKTRRTLKRLTAAGLQTDSTRGKKIYKYEKKKNSDLNVRLEGGETSSLWIGVEPKHYMPWLPLPPVL